MIIRIVLTGGPGSGKTKTIEFLKEKLLAEKSVFRFHGFRCLFVPETASELILGGVAPFVCNSFVGFQRILFDLQFEKEKAFDEAMSLIDEENFVIFYDRGLVDGGAYITDNEFEDLLNEKGYSIKSLYSRYDAVIGLETHESYYSTEENEARTENYSVAKRISERTLELWSGHENYYFVSAEEKFSQKAWKVLELLEKIITELS